MRKEQIKLIEKLKEERRAKEEKSRKVFQTLEQNELSYIDIKTIWLMEDPIHELANLLGDSIDAKSIEAACKKDRFAKTKNISTCLQVRMDREVEEKHYIIGGGFELAAGNWKIRFDFNNSFLSSCKDTICVTCEVLDIDYSDDYITADFIEAVDNIVECYIYTGEDEDPEINPVEILKWEFSIDGKIIELPKKLLKSYSFELD